MNFDQKLIEQPSNAIGSLLAGLNFGEVTRTQVSLMSRILFEVLEFVLLWSNLHN